MRFDGQEDIKIACRPAARLAAVTVRGGQQMTKDAPVLVEIADQVATVTLNRPKAINALSEDVLAALQTVWDDLAGSPDVKAVVLRGAGAHFCAGHNLKEMNARRADDDGGEPRHRVSQNAA